MAHAGSILAKVLREVKNRVKIGIATRELDEIAHKLVLSYGGEPAFFQYAPPGFARKFPASLCVSVNEEVVHGIPSERVLRDGDIVGLDFGVRYKEFHADGAITVPVGKTSEETQKLLRITQEALSRGIAQARIGNTVGDIGFAIQSWVEQNGFSVIRDLVGHGIGRELHEAPQVPNFGKAGTGVKLAEGMVIAIEPMVAAGNWKIELAPDGWAYRTADGSLSAHFEHTVAITKKGPKILTPLEISRS